MMDLNLAFYLISVCLMLIISTIWFLFYFLLRKKNQKIQQNFNSAEYLIRNILPETELEQNLEKILYVLQDLVEAPSYAFYILDSKNQNYILRAIRHQLDENAAAAPQYSAGLINYQKEKYYPPISLPVETSTKEIHIHYEGEVAVLLIPIHPGNGLILVGPVKNLSSKLKENIKVRVNWFEPTLHTLLEIEKTKSKIVTVEATDKALKIVNSMTFNVFELVRMTLQTAVRFYGISGGFLLTKSKDHVRVPVSMELSEENIHSLEADSQFAEQLLTWASEKRIAIISPHAPEYSRIQNYVSGDEEIQWALIKVNRESWSGVLGLAYDPDRCRNSSLSSVVVLFERLLENQRKMIISSTHRIEMLKNFAQMIDQISPYTVGYSDLMSRYSAILAKEKGLNEEEIRQISLAAYLSNIGIVDISEEIFLKEGKYTEREFETMKLHSEIGAAIVENILGSSVVAAYIKYHHERIDGIGYPSGLIGDEIPIGARIIAVVQTFLAKVNSRPYRPAVSFDQAINMLKTSAGTQLDSELVDLFCQWFERKREQAQFSGRALGPCWEMCCSPESICSKCPAYKQYEKNCWEMESNQCKEHGRECSSCYVFTEALARDTLSYVRK